MYTVRRVFLAQRPAFISKGPVVRDGFGITIVQADPRGSDAIGLFREMGHAPFGQRPQTACKLLASKDDGAAFIDLGCLHIVSGEGDEEYVYLLVRVFFKMLVLTFGWGMIHPFHYTLSGFF